MYLVASIQVARKYTVHVQELLSATLYIMEMRRCRLEDDQGFPWSFPQLCLIRMAELATVKLASHI